jgi:multiple sugar transport system permease protein
MFVSLLLILTAFILIWKRKTPRRVKIANVLYLLGEIYLLFHIFSLILNLILYGISDLPMLILIGEAYVFFRSFTVYIKKSGLKRRKVIVQALVAIGAIVFAFPFVWMLSTSLKSSMLTLSLPPRFFPFPLEWKNYTTCLNYPSFQFTLFARNTLYLCILTVSGTLVSSSLVAYGFSRIKWRGRDALFFLTLSTMMIPFPVYMIPLFKLFRACNWVGTFKPLWVPAFFGSAFNIFLFRQFFLTIPQDFSEAAFLDGAGDFWVFTKIIIPLSKPVILVVGLFQFLYTWNDFLGPLIYLPDQDTFTLSLGLQFFQSQHGGTEWNLLMAASTLVILPVLILFFLTQRVFVRGVTISNIQG